MEILRTEHLTKTYGQGENMLHAVHDVSFSIQQGEFVAIVGASGSGKSTLMHLIGGVDTPTSGKILVQDTNLSQLNLNQLAIFRRRQIGLVYQFYNLIPILTAEENITLPCDLDGQKPDPQRLEMLLHALGIYSKRHHLPNQLSGGQQQRVSIARALMNRPALLLADEPTGNLDSKVTEDIMGLLQSANRELHQTILMITHNMDLAQRAHRILRMQDGHLYEEV